MGNKNHLKNYMLARFKPKFYWNILMFSLMVKVRHDITENVYNMKQFEKEKKITPNSTPAHVRT